MFMFRSCDGPEPGRRSGSPCLDYYIKRCEAPCVGYVDKEGYRKAIDGVIAFLSGRYKEIEWALNEEMKLAAAEQRFEDAARERNRLRAVRSLLERQRVAHEDGSMDAIAVAVAEGEANAQVFQIRDGVLSDRQSFYLDNASEAELSPRSPRRSSSSTTPARCRCRRWWSSSASSGSAADLAPLAEALSARRGTAVEIRAAERGDKRRILELAERNAQPRDRPGEAALRAPPPAARRGARRPAAGAGARHVPLRIECFDISTLMGTNTVASMVVFEGGAPKKSDYRRFRVFTVGDATAPG